ncbi:MAG: nitric oxide reductase transcriptional regulator NorR [Myxococcales bacterium]|nr:nitric oxide reductase transcriptional regulator NorR [Myxococcales bacterium]
MDDLARSLDPRQRYQRLLEGLRQIVPCDAAALLKLERGVLRPVAVYGLCDDAMGRRFRPQEHPRLEMILRADQLMRFPADSALPDPYDGLVEGVGDPIKVHDCLGCNLYVDGQHWGILTLDSLTPGAFGGIASWELRAFIALAAASIKVADLITALQDRVERETEVNRTLVVERSTDMIGQSPQLLKLIEEVRMVAASDLSVLILGETGVGKELVANHLHRWSPRRAEPLVHVNCAALPESIAESELFGHVKGAFSGASAGRRGKFELAHGGTLLLDEVGELPLSIQAKLLRALQSGEIQRVGSDRNIEVDVRIIAATNRNLRREVRHGRFRADLYHRLSAYPVTVPPLRERQSDVLTLAGYFLEQNRARLGCRGLRIGSLAQQALLDYRWPGNVRELEHVIGRAALKALARAGDPGEVITVGPEDLTLEPEASVSVSASVADVREAIASAALDGLVGLPLRDALDDFQRRLIQRTLDEHGGNWAATARALDVDRSNLHRLAVRLGLK